MMLTWESDGFWSCNFPSLLMHNHRHGQSPFPALITLAMFLISWEKKNPSQNHKAFCLLCLSKCGWFNLNEILIRKILPSSSPDLNIYNCGKNLYKLGSNLSCFPGPRPWQYNKKRRRDSTNCPRGGLEWESGWETAVFVAPTVLIAAVCPDTFFRLVSI